MASGYTYRVEGLRKLANTVRESDDAMNDWLRHGLEEVGEKVAVDVRRAYSPYSAIGAEGVKTKVTKPGNVVVAQTLRRGRDMRKRRANFGGLMMRKAFLPAMDKHEATVAESVERLFVELEELWA